MKIHEQYDYNEESGIATYQMIVDGKIFTGEAICHPDDTDFANETTGLTIAHDRAILQYLRYMRDISYQRYLAYDLLLKQLRGCNRCNPDSFEAKSLKIERDAAYDDYKILQADARNFYNAIGSFIHAKDKVYASLREKRQAMDKID